MSRNVFAQPGAAAISMLLACLVMLAACSDLRSREDFSTLVREKSEQDVVKALGKPSQIDHAQPPAVRYVYTSRTFHIENGNKVDARAVVVFRPSTDGTLKAAEVSYD
jgi:hypothetical protein